MFFLGNVVLYDFEAAHPVGMEVSVLFLGPWDILESMLEVFEERVVPWTVLCSGWVGGRVSSH